MSSSSCISSDDFKCGTNYSMLHSSILYKYEMAGLHYAKYLIDNGCDANLINSSGDTAIHQVAKHSRKRFRKQDDLNNNSKGRYLKSDLMYLIDKGCDINATNSRGKTALHYCINELDSTTTKYLIELGADCRIKDDDSLNAYEYAFKDFDEIPSDNKIDIYIEDTAVNLNTDRTKDIDIAFASGHNGEPDSKSNSLADYLTGVAYKETSGQVPSITNDRVVQLFKIIIILLETGIIFNENPVFWETKSVWFKSAIMKCEKEILIRKANGPKRELRLERFPLEVATMARYFHEKCGMEPECCKKYASKFRFFHIPFMNIHLL
jgi:hypothetical protein